MRPDLTRRVLLYFVTPSPIKCLIYGLCVATGETEYSMGQTSSKTWMNNPINTRPTF